MREPFGARSSSAHTKTTKDRTSPAESFSVPLCPLNAWRFSQATGLSLAAWPTWSRVLFLGGTGFYSGAQLARRSGTSEATISRVLRWARRVGILVEACGQRFLAWTGLFEHKAGLRLKNLETALAVEGRSLAEILSGVEAQWKPRERPVKESSICINELEQEPDQTLASSASSRAPGSKQQRPTAEEQQGDSAGCVAGMDREEWSEVRARQENTPQLYRAWRKQTPEEMIATRLGIPVEAVSEEHMPWLDREAMRDRIDKKLLFHKGFCAALYQWAVADDPRAPFALRKRAEEMRAHGQVLQPHHVLGWLRQASSPTSNEANRITAVTCWEDFEHQEEEHQAELQRREELAQRAQQPEQPDEPLPEVPMEAMVAFREKSNVPGWQRITAWDELAAEKGWPSYGEMIKVARAANLKERV